MDLLQIIFMAINVISLVLLGVGCFKSRFTIVDLETWNTIVAFYNEHAEDESDNCGGGVGFFYDQLPQESEDEEEEPEDE